MPNSGLFVNENGEFKTLEYFIDEGGIHIITDLEDESCHWIMVEVEDAE